MLSSFVLSVPDIKPAVPPAPTRGSATFEPVDEFNDLVAEVYVKSVPTLASAPAAIPSSLFLSEPVISPDVLLAITSGSVAFPPVDDWISRLLAT